MKNKILFLLVCFYNISPISPKKILFYLCCFGNLSLFSSKTTKKEEKTCRPLELPKDIKEDIEGVRKRVNESPFLENSKQDSINLLESKRRTLEKIESIYHEDAKFSNYDHDLEQLLRYEFDKAHDLIDAKVKEFKNK